MRGRTSRAKKTLLRRVRSTAARHSSREISANFLAGGPPALGTQMSTCPNFLSTASTNCVTASGFVTSTARQNMARPLAAPISSAVSSRSAAVRAQIATSQPSLASSSATARPRPLLAAATMATRPFSPKSMCQLFLFRASAKVGIIFADPIFAARREEVKINGVFESFGTVRHVGRNGQDFAGTDDGFGLVVENKFQGAGSAHGVLLAAMKMARDDRAAQKHEAGKRSVVAANHLARDQGIQFIGFEHFELFCDGHRRLLGAIYAQESSIETGESSMAEE